MDDEDRSAAGAGRALQHRPRPRAAPPSAAWSTPSAGATTPRSSGRCSSSASAAAGWPPSALIVGAFLMLFQGLKLLVTNWRLTLVQIIPAMWIWVAMLDIKIHVLHGKQFHVLRGPVLIPAVLGVTALTAASFYLNGVFAFAISEPGKPEIRPAFAKANQHLRGDPRVGRRHRPGAVVLRARSPRAGATGPSSSARASSSAS